MRAGRPLQIAPNWDEALWEGKWSHSDHEFGPVCKHVTGIVFPTARWVGLKGHLVPTRRCNGTHFKKSMAVLREHFPDVLILIRSDLELSARFPDLTPCDFFLWGFLKSRVYVNHPRTLQDLKTNIREESANIAPAMLAGVMTNARNRFTRCMENGRCHLPDVIFKTN